MSCYCVLLPEDDDGDIPLLVAGLMPDARFIGRDAGCEVLSGGRGAFDTLEGHQKRGSIL